MTRNIELEVKTMFMNDTEIAENAYEVWKRLIPRADDATLNKLRFAFANRIFDLQKIKTEIDAEISMRESKLLRKERGRSLKRRSDGQRTMRHRTAGMIEKRRRGAMLGYKGY